MSPYKVPGEVTSLALVTNEPLVEEHRGPRTKCPACGHGPKLAKCKKGHVNSLLVPSCAVCANDLTIEADQPASQACSGQRSWWKRLLGIGCSRSGLHLHQSCSKCKAAWTCAPLEDV